MHIHILGICGVFMGGVALLARDLGHKISGSDSDVYPPMSDELRANGIEITCDLSLNDLASNVDLVLVGNALSRGDPAVEYLLEHDIPYQSGAQWIAENILYNRWTIAVSGTHGKTTTAALTAFLMRKINLDPGFLIGGVPLDLDCFAHLGNSPFFIIEADEYDTAFFDKRSKFIHYRPRTLIFNNLEFDHADIFDNLQAIERQFCHLLRTMPASGRVLFPANDANIKRLLDSEPWSERASFAIDASAAICAHSLVPDYSRFTLEVDGALIGKGGWSLSGKHNLHNAMAALAAIHHVGGNIKEALASLNHFQGVKKRMEKIAEIDGIEVYEDFAHHPTAILETLRAARAKFPNVRLIAVIEPRSNTMKRGVHRDQLIRSTSLADHVYWLQSDNLVWSIDAAIVGSENHAMTFPTVDRIIEQLVSDSLRGDRIIVMSNGNFENLSRRLISALDDSRQ